MQVEIYKDYEALSARAADEIIELVKNKQNAVLCLASGDTPRLTCTLAVAKALKEKVDFSRCTFIGLDEWVGVPPENEGSCYWFFQRHLFQPLKMNPSQIYLFNGMSDNLNEECNKMDSVIAAKGGIDLMIVGIGMNGHIGFNEPGVSFDNHSHVIDLDPITLSVGQKYFTETVKLGKGITLGLKHLMQTKKVLLIANGSQKAEVIKRTVEEKVSEQIPATIMQTHSDGMLMIDKEAASLLSENFLHENK
jgi:galactosamine-6-phosphate isomerase